MSAKSAGKAKAVHSQELLRHLEAGTVAPGKGKQIESTESSITVLMLPIMRGYSFLLIIIIASMFPTNTDVDSTYACYFTR